MMPLLKGEDVKNLAQSRDQKFTRDMTLMNKPPNKRRAKKRSSSIYKHPTNMTNNG